MIILGFGQPLNRSPPAKKFEKPWSKKTPETLWKTQGVWFLLFYEIYVPFKCLVKKLFPTENSIKRSFSS